VLPFRELIEDVDDLVIPTVLLLGFRIDVPPRLPDPQLPIADHEPWRPHPTLPQSAEHRAPTLGRFPIPRRDGEPTFRPSLNAARPTSRAAVSFSNPAFT
jgi:hypothetical protein